MKRAALLLAAVLALAGTGAAAVTSADLVRMDSDGSEFFTGPTFLIEFTSNYNTDQITVNLDNQLDDAAGQQVDGQLSIDVTTQDTMAVYSFRDPGMEDIYQFEPVKSVVDISIFDDDPTMHRKIRESDISGTCYDLDGSGTFSTGDYYGKEGFEGFNHVVRVYCIKKGQKVGNVGEISSNPRSVFITSWTVTNGEKTETAVISNADMGSGLSKRIGPNVHVAFESAGTAGRTPPVSTDELVLHSNGLRKFNLITGQWETVNDGFRVISRTRYTEYRNSFDGTMNLLRQWGDEGSEFRDDVTAGINNQALRAAEPHPDTEFADAEFRGQSVDDGRMVLQSDNLIYPQFSIYVKACRAASFEECSDGMLKIVKPVGRPEITDVSGVEITEVETGTVSVTYQNVADTEGSFAARITSCTEGFSFTGVTQRATLGSGESTTVYFPVGFSSTSSSSLETSGSCTVEVSETSADISVTDVADVTGVQQQECTPGEQFRDIQNGTAVVKECSQDGLTTSIVKRCGQDEQAVATGNGTYQCASGSDPVNPPPVTEDQTDCSIPVIDLPDPSGEPEFSVPDPVCHIKQATTGPWQIVKLFAAFLAFLFGYGLRGFAVQLADIGGPVAVLGQDVRVQWVIGIILGLITATFAFALLSNPVIKWTIVIVGTIGLLLYVWLFSWKDLAMMLIPVGR